MAAVQISIPVVRFWAPLPAVIAAGILSTYYFGMTGTFWAVTGEFTRWGGHVLQWFGLHPEQWGYFKVIGLQGHAAGAHRRAHDHRHVRRLHRCCAVGQQHQAAPAAAPIRIVQALLGGIIAGFGARLAMGCNLAAFFTGIPQFSLRLVLRAGDRRRLLLRRQIHAAADVPHPGQIARLRLPRR